MNKLTKDSIEAPAPLRIAVTCDVTGIGESPEHGVKEKYIEAVADGCGAFPIMLPAFVEGGEMASLFERIDLDHVMEGIDALFLTGTSSNVEPTHYNGPIDPDASHKFDRQRDHSNLQLIRWALAQKLPIFGLCQGLQEINVALSGTLVTDVESIPENIEHVAASHLSKAEQYRPAHEIKLTQGGQLNRFLNTDTIEVNSLHEQVLGVIADDLIIASKSSDGPVEAVSHKDPEHSSQVFGYFGQMVRDRKLNKTTTIRQV